MSTDEHTYKYSSDEPVRGQGDVVAIEPTKVINEAAKNRKRNTQAERDFTYKAPNKKSSYEDHSVRSKRRFSTRKSPVTPRYEAYRTAIHAAETPPVTPVSRKKSSQKDESTIQATGRNGSTRETQKYLNPKASKRKSLANGEASHSPRSGSKTSKRQKVAELEKIETISNGAPNLPLIPATDQRNEDGGTPSHAKSQGYKKRATKSSVAERISDLTYQDSPSPEHDDEYEPRLTLSVPRRPSQRAYNPKRSHDSQAEREEARLEPTSRNVRRETDVGAVERAGHARKVDRDSRRETDFAGMGEMEFRLFAAIDQRGFEPFLPLAWHLDFPVKDAAYYGEDAHTTHVNTLDFDDSNANFRGMRALQQLIEIGPKVRDRHQVMGRRPEPFIARQIRAYMEWADGDAGLDRSRRRNGDRAAPPLLAVAYDSTVDGSGQLKLVETLERRMRRLAVQWRSWQTHGAAGFGIATGDLAGGGGINSTGSGGNIIMKGGGETSTKRWRMLKAESSAAAATYASSNVLPMREHDNSGRGSRGSIVNSSGSSVDGADGNEEFSPTTPHRTFSSVLRWVGRVMGSGSRDKGRSITDRKTSHKAAVATTTAAAREAVENSFPIDAVYGIAICHTVVAILSYRLSGKGSDEEGDNNGNGSGTSDNGSNNSSDGLNEKGCSDRRQPQMIFYVDFSKPAEDLWNAVALAITVCHCRDLRVACSEKFKLPNHEGDSSDNDF